MGELFIIPNNLGRVKTVTILYFCKDTHKIDRTYSEEGYCNRNE